MEPTTGSEPETNKPSEIPSLLVRKRYHIDWHQVFETILAEELQASSDKEHLPTLLGLVSLLRKKTQAPWLTLYRFTQDYCERNNVQLATISHLPAHDSLVRASSEPTQAQESVLLRAAAEGVETPPEQLVRASVEQE